MRFYSNQHKYYCGIDLHANKMYVCIIDNTGKTLVHRNIPAKPQPFLRIVAPYREDVVVGIECMFCWYWLCDVCQSKGIEFILGHALYMRGIHGAKAKNDKLDSEKLAVMLRGGAFPMSYAYPKELRATRDLMRRRSYFVQRRAELMRHVHMTHQQYNLEPPKKSLKPLSNLKEFENPFEDESVARMVQSDLTMLESYTNEINQLDWYLEKTAKADSDTAFQRALLQTIPGVGEVLSLTMLYEIGDIARFPTVQQFCSYSRLVKPEKTSAGKRSGSGGGKIGNPHLKWAFSEAAALFLRQSDDAKKYLARLEKRYGKKAKAMSVLSHKLGKAVAFCRRQNPRRDNNNYSQESAKPIGFVHSSS